MSETTKANQPAEENSSAGSDTTQSLLDLGSAMTRTAHGTVYCLTIIGRSKDT